MEKSTAVYVLIHFPNARPSTWLSKLRESLAFMRGDQFDVLANVYPSPFRQYKDKNTEILIESIPVGLGYANTVHGNQGVTLMRRLCEFLQKSFPLA